MTTGLKKITMGVFCAVIITLCSFCTASAQNKIGISRVAVVANETKTNIWVSDFPKKTTVIISDTENNLLSITSTNDYGALFLSLPQGIKTGVVVKTIDGEISASNRVVIKAKQEEQNVVRNYFEETNKA